MADKGAHFFRCDFQVHSPRDGNWTGPDCITDDERRAYAEKLVEACRDRGLHAIAVTDHHDMLFAGYVRRAAEDEKDGNGQLLPKEQRLTVFPGMELTLGVPCQALLIFDAAFPDDLFQLATTALALTPSAATEAKTAPVQRLNHIQSLRQLKDELDKHTFLRDRYIVFPNVTNEGQFSIFRTGLAGKYIEMPWVGGYVDGACDDLDAGIKNRIAGKDKNWGNKRIACFQTSDSRREDHRELGQHSTWVKWAVPSAEALRQACLAQESRVSQLQPHLPPVAVEAISISNSSFLGPIELELNPQYSALIGGRGTGKSTLLEYLRWALCDQPLAIDEDEMPDFQQRRTSLIEKTLRALDANVQVAVLVNGTEHVVRRHVDGRLLLKIGTDEFRAATEDEIRLLLPMQAYSQKQLSSVGIKGDELRRFVHLPIQVDLDALHTKVSDIATRIRAAHEALREHRRLLKDSVVTRTELQSIEQQLNALRQGLKGVTDADRIIIAAQPGWVEERRIVDRWRKELTQAATGLQELRDQIARLPTAVGVAKVQDPKRISEMEGLLRDLFNGLNERLGTAQSVLAAESAAHQKFDGASTAWDTAAEENRKKYEEAKGRAAESEAAIKQIAELERRQRELLDAVATRDRRLAELGDPEKRYEELQQEWRTAHAERTQILDAQCKKLSALSKGLLRASVKRAAGTGHVATALKELVKGTKMRGEKFEQLLQGVAADVDPLSAWLDVVRELRALSELDEVTSPLPPCPRLGSAQIADGDRRKMAEKLAFKGWVDFATLELEDVPRFEYKAREGEYIEFSDASAGQQATALMFVLLNQDGPPLIIDQPEDDLDNHVIKDIVEQLWVAKSKRQLVFSSHNANLVVNGDAELVIACDYRAAGDQSGGTIKIQGAIDIDAVRTEIATVMEGGREAFTLRKEKYGF